MVFFLLYDDKKCRSAAGVKIDDTWWDDKNKKSLKKVLTIKTMCGIIEGRIEITYKTLYGRLKRWVYHLKKL